LIASTTDSPGVRFSRSVRNARSITQRSMSAIMPKRSAVGRNALGEMSSPCGSRRRSSTSYTIGLPGLRLSWRCSRSPSSGVPRPSSSMPASGAIGWKHSMKRSERSASSSRTDQPRSMSIAARWPDSGV
jgi:hypothetical protein